MIQKFCKRIIPTYLHNNETRRRLVVLYTAVLDEGL